MKEYKLYRTLYDIIHPSISRKNIANYEIMIEDELLPLQIYYPNKEVTIDKVIIYIADKISNYNIYTELAKRTGNLVIVIDSKNKHDVDNYYNTIKYIYDNISTTGVNPSNITVMSDFEGTTIEQNILKKSKKAKSFSINKSILLGPELITIDNIENSKNKLIIVDKEESHNNYVKIYLKNFIRGNDLATNEKVFSLINEFLN